MRPRAVALATLVLLAALLGAPPRASAAANQLLDPAVGPTSGSVVTLFTFHVRYEGSFPALGVTTTVAGLTLPMLRTTGTASAGTWTVAATLPAGTWRPTFAAVAAQGNQPTLVGPPVVVAAPVATAEPTDAPADVAPTPGDSAPTASSRTGPVDDGGAPTSTPPPAAPVAPSLTPVPGAPTPSPASAPATAPPTAPSGGTAGPAAAPAAGPGGDDAPDGVPASAPAASPGGSTDSAMPASSGSGTPRGSADTEHGIPSALGGADAASPVTGVLVVGLSGVAAVALLGLVMLLARRQRERDGDPQPVPAADPVTPERARPRPSRRSSVELADDPIVAAMGLGRDETTPHRRRGRPAD